MWSWCYQTPFHPLNANITFQIYHEDGIDVEADTDIAILTGPAQTLLTGERVALNLLGRLSAIATPHTDVRTKLPLGGHASLILGKRHRASVIWRSGRFVPGRYQSSSWP